MREMTLCTESGLYQIIFSVQRGNQFARKFKRWVTHTVLPQIRQSGSYQLNPTEERRLCLEESKAEARRIELYLQIKKTTKDAILLNLVDNKIKNMMTGVQAIEHPGTEQPRLLSEILEGHGYTISKAHKLATSRGRAIVKAYRRSRGCEPKKTISYVGGRRRDLRVYLPSDWPIIQSELPSK